jgi:hypothetical protein
VWVATDWRYEQVDWRDALARAEALEPRAPVLAVTRFGTPVVQTYLHRRPLTRSALVTQRAWIVVEPTRTAGQRSLVAAQARTLGGFSTVRELENHAFRLILVSASRPTSLAPGVIADSSLFPGRT